MINKVFIGLVILVIAVLGLPTLASAYDHYQRVRCFTTSGASFYVTIPLGQAAVTIPIGGQQQVRCYGSHQQYYPQHQYQYPATPYPYGYQYPVQQPVYMPYPYPYQQHPLIAPQYQPYPYQPGYTPPVQYPRPVCPWPYRFDPWTRTCR